MAMAMAMSGSSLCGVPLRQRVPRLMSATETTATRLRRRCSKVAGVAGHGYGEAGVRSMAATDGAKAAPYASYAVPLEKSHEPSLITRPLAEILRDMNKRVPDKVLKTRNDEGVVLKYIPWYHANRMLSFYAPGWSGEVRSIVFSNDGSTVSVVYRVTIRGSDGESWRESSGTAAVADTSYGDPVQKAEGMAFRRACARFGLGLYLYHEDEVL